jgi:hypothetical protein
MWMSRLALLRAPFHAGSAAYRGQDLYMTSTSADQTFERGLHLLVARMWVFVQQRFGGQHPSIQAVATLESLLLDERHLNRMWMFRGSHPPRVVMSLPITRETGNVHERMGV